MFISLTHYLILIYSKINTIYKLCYIAIIYYFKLQSNKVLDVFLHQSIISAEKRGYVQHVKRTAPQQYKEGNTLQQNKESKNGMHVPTFSAQRTEPSQDHRMLTFPFFLSTGGRGTYCHNHTGNPITKYFAKTIHHIYLINIILQKL